MVKKEKKRPAKASAGNSKDRKRLAVPGSFRLTRRSLGVIRAYWKTLGGIMLVYLVLNIILAGGISTLNSTVSTFRAEVETLGAGRLTEVLGEFGSLVASSGAEASQTGGVFRALLLIIISLVIIWALRQMTAGSSAGVKQSFYQSMGPLIPFILIIAVIFVQLLPLTVGAPVLSAILTTVFNPSALLSAVLIAIFIALAAWSLYMLVGSLLALYIVTLPGMEPLASLRSAKNLARFRRIILMRRILYLPIFIFAAMAAVMVPVILLLPFLVVPVFYTLSVAAILFAHTYLYSLYRSLLE